MAPFFLTVCDMRFLFLSPGHGKLPYKNPNVPIRFSIKSTFYSTFPHIDAAHQETILRVPVSMYQE